MTDETRPPPSTLKGRLADVYVPALVDGALEALARRLGNRATIDDPVHGRASSLASCEALVARASQAFRARGALYRHVYSTTGINLDAAEGVLSMTKGGETRELPIAVIAERKRLREIELRIYYAEEPGASPQRTRRGAIAVSDSSAVVPPQMEAVLEAMRAGGVERALDAFEDAGRIVDPHGTRQAKRDGTLASFLGGLGPMSVVVSGTADDGRTCSLEAMVAHGRREPVPAVLSFERGDSGLLRELRLYWD
jgi:hypothetical protein